MTSHPINPAHVAEGKRVADELWQAAFGRPAAQAGAAYQIARCGQLSVHAPHVVDHGPDQPRNCPGVAADWIQVDGANPAV